ncbi:hypothetical protein HRbin30_02113 [bacterium HR30]|nr:hypothetical protein HRbin30_02113 [bacterium HR30]
MSQVMNRMAESPRVEGEPPAESPIPPSLQAQTGTARSLGRWREQWLNFGATPQQYEKWLDRLLLAGLLATAAICVYIFFVAG